MVYIIPSAIPTAAIFNAGAEYRYPPSAGPDTLAEAIGQVYNGEQYLDVAFSGSNLSDLMKARSHVETIPTLTKREKEVLGLIAEELSSPQIAKRLFISVSAVDNHRFNLLFKLGVKNAVGLVKKAMQMGLVKA